MTAAAYTLLPQAPPVHTPAPGRLPLPARLGAPDGSTTGRSLINLWLALLAPKSDIIRAALEASVKEGLAAVAHQNAPLTPQLHDLLIGLAWAMIEAGRLDEGASWLGEVDRLFPESRERLALRWSLLKTLLKSGASAAYAAQAGIFLDDPLAAEYESAVLEVCGGVHQHAPPEKRRHLYASVNPAIAQDVRVRAAMVQWCCPASFSSESEAASWTEHLAPQHLEFAPMVQADAFLALARIAEWQRDWATMEARSWEALAASPKNLEAIFLLTRSRLRQPGAELPAELHQVPPTADAKWQRLRRQCDFHRNSSLANAHTLAETLPEAVGAGDRQELDLVVGMVNERLTWPSAQVSDLDTYVKLSRQLEGVVPLLIEQLPFFRVHCPNCHHRLRFEREYARHTVDCTQCQTDVALNLPGDMAGVFPWAALQAALHQLYVERDFASAYRRAERVEFLGFAPAQRIAQIARVLAGSPGGLERRPDADPALVALATGLRAVAAGGPTPDWPELEGTLDAALSDPTVQTLPPLAAATQVLRLAVRHLRGDATADEPSDLKVPADAPPWAVWLFGRLVELGASAAPAAQRYQNIPLANAALAWRVELGWCNHGAEPREAADVVDRARALLDERFDARTHPFLAGLRASRLGRYRQAAPAEGDAPPVDLFPELGEVCAGQAQDELLLEADFARSRVALAQGRPDVAGAAFGEAAAGRLHRLGPLAQAWWQPVLTYWRGVAWAHGRDGRAASLLETLTEGIRSNEALGQLALLDLQRGDTASALQRLERASDLVPAVRYARALALARANRPEAACRRLDYDGPFLHLGGDSSADPISYEELTKRIKAGVLTAKELAWYEGLDGWQRLDEIFPELFAKGTREAALNPKRQFTLAGDSAASPYARAAHRLVAAVKERQGKGAECARLQAELLAICPTDEITILRAIRFSVQGTRANGPASASGAATIEAYLQKLFSTSTPESLARLAAVSATPTGESQDRVWWRQFLASGLLRAGRTAEAHEVLLAATESVLPPAVERSRCIMRLWSALTGSAGGETRQEAADRLHAARTPELAHWLEYYRAGDPLASPWAVWARIALALAENEQMDPAEAAALSTTPLQPVVDLLGPDAARRRQAAEILAAPTEPASLRWSVRQQTLAQAHVAWVLGRDEEFLERYAAFAESRDALPVQGRDLWLAAASLRYGKKDWKGVLGQAKPPDGEAPLIRLVQELAALRMAGDESLKGDRRESALAKIRDVRHQLTAMIQSLPAAAGTTEPVRH